MAEKTFSAEIDGWVRQTRERIEFVFREAAQDLAEEVVAKAPIDTGFLRHSFTASGEQMPVIRADARPAEGAKYAFDSAAVNLTIANVPLGGTIYFGFVAKYALRIEYGFVGEDSLGRSFNQPGRGMVRLAAMNWKWHVAEATARAQAAVRANERRDRSL
jgi:hypothetical protein